MRLKYRKAAAEMWVQLNGIDEGLHYREFVEDVLKLEDGTVIEERGGEFWINDTHPKTRVDGPYWYINPHNGNDGFISVAFEVIE